MILHLKSVPMRKLITHHHWAGESIDILIPCQKLICDSDMLILAPL